MKWLGVVLVSALAYGSSIISASEDSESFSATVTGLVDPSNVTGVACVNDCEFRGGDICYHDLASAVFNATEGSTVFISGNITISEEIRITKNITIVGTCNTTIIASFVDPNSTYGNQTGNYIGLAIFRGETPLVTLSLVNISFVNSQPYGSVFRTHEQGTGMFVTSSFHDPIGLSVSGCSFRNFRTALRGGSVFFIGVSGNISIIDSVFENNSVEYFINVMYEGCGAIWVWRTEGVVNIINSTFAHNIHTFGHSLGGAIGINNVTSNLTIKGGSFFNNSANGGGAIFLGRVQKNSTVVIDSYFYNNTARDMGFMEGARGGVAWIERIFGVVHVRGTYRNNTSIGDRGGAFANNRLLGTVYIDNATFVNNTATSGSVWSTVYRTKGDLIIRNLTEYDNGNRPIRLVEDAPYIPNENKTVTISRVATKLPIYITHTSSSTSETTSSRVTVTSSTSTRRTRTLTSTRRPTSTRV